MSIRDVATVKESAPAEKSRHGSYRDTRSPIRLGIWILLVGFGGFWFIARVAFRSFVTRSREKVATIVDKIKTVIQAMHI